MIPFSFFFLSLPLLATAGTPDQDRRVARLRKDFSQATITIQGSGPRSGFRPTTYSEPAEALDSDF